MPGRRSRGRCVAPLLVPATDGAGRAIAAQDPTNLPGVLLVFGKDAFDVGLDQFVGRPVGGKLGAVSHYNDTIW